MKTFNPGPNPQLSHEYVNYRSLHIWNTLPAAFFGFALFCLSYTTSFLPSYPWLPRAFRDRLTTNHVLLQSSCSRRETKSQTPPSAPGQRGLKTVMAILNSTAGISGRHPWMQGAIEFKWHTAALNGSRVTVSRRQHLFYGLASTDGWPPIRSFPHGWQSLWELAHALATLPSIPHRASSQQI